MRRPLLSLVIGTSLFAASVLSSSLLHSSVATPASPSLCTAGCAEVRCCHGLYHHYL